MKPNPEPESHLDFYRRWHRNTKPYIRWQLEQFEPFLGRRVADVGCGLGNFAEYLATKELYLGIDADEELLAELRKEYGHHPGVKTTNIDITSPACTEALRAERVDTIICVNVIEHIEDHARAVRNMVDALPPGGHLGLLVPALPVLMGTLDRLDGHYRRYTKPVLRGVLDGLPGDLLQLYYFNLPAVAGWFVKGRILKQERHTDDNYHIMNAILPAVRWCEKRVHPPFGMSLVAVFRKAAGPGAPRAEARP
jgi:SAM-dependent methyltransferase